MLQGRFVIKPDRNTHELHLSNSGHLNDVFFKRLEEENLINL